MPVNIRRMRVEDSRFVPLNRGSSFRGIGEARIMKHIVYGIVVGLILGGLFGFSTVSFAGKWEAKANLHIGRYAHATSVVNGKIYAIGGQDNSPQIMPPVEEYDPVADTWTEKSRIPVGRFLLSASTVGEKIYVIGGFDGLDAFARVDEYDPKTDTWAQKADMPTPRLALTTVTVGKKIYAIGGANADMIPSGAVEVYDPATDTWEQKADMPSPRWNLASAAVLGTIYVIGGCLSDSDRKGSNIVEAYAPATDTWEEKADFWLDTNGISASAVDNGMIYVFGGQKWEGKEGKGGVQAAGKWVVYKTVAEYDRTENKWRMVEEMLTERWGLGTGVIDGKIYAVGGWPRRVDWWVNREKTEEYTPDGWPFPVNLLSVSSRDKLATTWGEIKRRQ